MAAKKKKPNKQYSDKVWADVEAAYRAGILSLRQISEAYGPSEAAIRKKAKLLNWEKVSKEEIKKEREKRLEENPGTELDKCADGVRSEEHIPDREPQEERAVKEAGELQAQVVREHRTTIQGARYLVEEMMATLQGKFRMLNDIEALAAAIATGEDGKIDAKLRGVAIKLMGLDADSGVLLKLTQSLEKVVKMERQAFGIKDEEGDQTKTY